MLGQKVVWGKVVQWVKIFYFEFSHFHLAIYKICSPLFPIFIVLRSPLGKIRTSVPSLWDLLENFKTQVEKGGVSVSSGQQTNFQLQKNPLLTHSFLMHPGSTRWKHQKTLQLNISFKGIFMKLRSSSKSIWLKRKTIKSNKSPKKYRTS